MDKQNETEELAANAVSQLVLPAGESGFNFKSNRLDVPKTAGVKGGFRCISLLFLLVSKDDKNQTMTFSGGFSRTKQNTYKCLKEFDNWGIIYQSLVGSCADL